MSPVFAHCMSGIVVDRKLHTGEVSDTQLAMADMKANK